MKHTVVATADEHVVIARRLLSAIT
jgi:hypothetical protein